jgi:hypothetical protein
VQEGSLSSRGLNVLASSNTLSPDFVKRLKPALRKAYFDVPEALQGRTADFVARGGETTIDPSRLLMFALLRAVAENQFQGDAVGAEHPRPKHCDSTIASRFTGFAF